MPTVALFSDKEFKDPEMLPEEEFREQLERQFQEYNRTKSPDQPYIYTDGHGHMIDFSDPVSTFKTQAPPDPGRIIYTSAYSPNPNIQPPNQQQIPQSNNFVRQVYTAVPTTNNYPMGPINRVSVPYVFSSRGMMTPEETAKFMIPLPNDTRIPYGVVEYVTEEDEFPKFKVPEFKNGRPVKRNTHLDDLDKLKVEVVYEYTSKPIKKGSRIRYNTVYNPPPHKPHTAFTKEELDPANWTYKVIADTPLLWTKEDENELQSLCDMIRPYDAATAYVFYWFMHGERFNHNEWEGYNFDKMDPVTREDYEFIKMYIKALIYDYKLKEKNDKFDEYNYQSSYRYRETPLCIWKDEHLIQLVFNCPTVPSKRVCTESGDWEYEYDRGTDDLSMDDWDMFALRAFADMMTGASIFKDKEIEKINQKPEKKQKKEPVLPPYNPLDPVVVRLYELRKSEKAYERNKEFFRDVFRDRMDDEEFEKWWLGDNMLTRMSRGPIPPKPMTKEESHRLWAKQMTAENIRFLNTLRPYDLEAEKRWAADQIQRALYNYHQGAIRSDMSLAEFFQHLRYLGDLRIREMNRKNNSLKSLSPDGVLMTSAKRTHEEIMKRYFADNPNPEYYNSHYGTSDDRLPSTGQVLDLSEDPNYAIFCAASESRSYNQPLKPLYKF